MEKIALSLVKAGLKDAPEIHAMQREAFKPLLAKYQDFDISPGAEPLEKVQERLRQDFTHFYIVKLGETSIGAVRVVLKDTGERCRISPIFILPEHQNRGFAQEVFRLIEKLYSPRNGWELDTILEEEGNCHLYEKLGYRKTGEFKKIKPGMTLVFYEKTEINLFKGAHESA